MRKLYYTTIALFLFLILLSPKILFSEEEKLKIEIDLYKTELLLMEPVWMDVTLSNLSSDSIRTSFLCPECTDGSLVVKLFDTGGNLITYSGPSINSIGGLESTFLINAGENYTRVINLQRFFGVHEHGLYGAVFMNYIPVGSYVIQISLPGYPIKKIEFKIIEPIGRDKDEYDATYKAYLAKRDTESNNVFNEFINKYPTSVYLEKILKDSNRYSELIGRFPNSGFSDSILKSLVRQLPVEKKQEFLQKIILNNPNSRSAKYAKQILNKQKLNKKEE